MPPKSMHSDAQWAWLFNRFREGHTITEVAYFAGCSTATLMHHWRRLGLRFWKNELTPMSRDEFNALRRFGNG